MRDGAAQIREELSVSMFPFAAIPANESIVAYADRLITRQQLSRWLGITADRLSIWAQRGVGPRALRVGRYKTRYRIGDVLDWLDKQDVTELPAVRRGGRKSATQPVNQQENA